MKKYKAICSYQTINNNTFSITAENEQDAYEVANVIFEDWNKKWKKDGGNDKKLISIKIEEQ